MSRKVRIREGEKSRHIPVLEAILLKSTEEALRGHLKATAFLLTRLASIQSNDVPASSELSPDETEVMKAYAERLLRERTEHD
jgi:hypothetical protein